jgi:hypothetical protein
MNRKIIIALLVLVVAAGLFFGYRAYKVSVDRELAQQRAAAQLALIKEHEAELARRMAAIVEARQMAEARARDEMERQERLREEQAAAQAAVAAAQAEIDRLAAETARLAAERDAGNADAARLAADRQRDADAAQAARQAALQKLHDLDEKRALADRETARRAALLHQQELEAEAQRLALEQERNSYKVGGYLITDIQSIRILQDNPLRQQKAAATATDPAQATPPK